MTLREIGPDDNRPLQDIADLLAKSHKILLITGAGISTSCGIPDFRSKDGLYNLVPSSTFSVTPPHSVPSTPTHQRRVSIVEDEELPPSSQSSITSTSSRRSSSVSRLRGQDLFDSRIWQDSMTTAVFYRFIASLRKTIRDEIKQSSLTHQFIRTLRDGGRLMRCYTQNIDGLEAREDLCMDLRSGKGTKRRYMKKTFTAPRPPMTQNTDFDGGCEVVPLHGDLEQLRCNLCQQVVGWNEEATAAFLDGGAPACDVCQAKHNERVAKSKRGVAVGSLRPNVVLYGEEHPSNELLAPLVPFDVASKPEVLVIMGTSLRVFGLQKIVKEFAKAIHARKDGRGKVIFINRTRPADSVWYGIIDHYVAMNCDDWVRDLRIRREDLWLRQGELDLQVTKPAAQRKRKRAKEAEGINEKRTKTVGETFVPVDVPDNAEALSASCTQPPNLAEQALPSPPPSREVTNKDQTAFSKPRSNRVGEAHTYDNPFESYYSPGRPSHSLLRKTFKLPNCSKSTLPRTPERPLYSPPSKFSYPSTLQENIPPGSPTHPTRSTPTTRTPLRKPSRLNVLTSGKEEYLEAYDEGDEEAIAPETPSAGRKPGRKPLSESQSNQ